MFYCSFEFWGFPPAKLFFLCCSVIKHECLKLSFEFVTYSFDYPSKGPRYKCYVNDIHIKFHGLPLHFSPACFLNSVCIKSHVSYIAE